MWWLSPLVATSCSSGQRRGSREHLRVYRLTYGPRRRWWWQRRRTGIALWSACVQPRLEDSRITHEGEGHEPICWAQDVEDATPRDQAQCNGSGRHEQQGHGAREHLGARLLPFHRHGELYGAVRIPVSIWRCVGHSLWFCSRKCGSQESRMTAPSALSNTCTCQVPSKAALDGLARLLTDWKEWAESWGGRPWSQSFSQNWVRNPKFPMQSMHRATQRSPPASPFPHRETSCCRGRLQLN